jgi:integrase
MALSFDLAIRRSRYFRPNPWRVEKAPKHQTKEIRILRQDEVARFVSATAKDRFEALWLLCLFCGLRLGEALGLTLDAIDWKTGEIQIRQQVTEVNGVAAVGKPKTAESIRSIYADPIVLDALRRRRKVALKEGHGSPYLFTTTTGHFISRTNLRSRHFAKVCERAEITGLTIHSLRHKFTSEAVDKGKSLIAVAQYLGHRSTRMVTDRYGWHRQEHQQRAVAEAVAEGILSIASGGMGTQGQPASAE